MFQLDFLVREAEAAARDPDGLDEAAEKLAEVERWGADPAYEAWLARRVRTADAAFFRGLQEQNRDRAAEARAAAEAGDAQELVRALRTLRVSCEACHLRFRPGPPR